MRKIFTVLSFLICQLIFSQQPIIEVNRIHNYKEKSEDGIDIICNITKIKLDKYKKIKLIELKYLDKKNNEILADPFYYDDYSDTENNQLILTLPSQKSRKITKIKGKLRVLESNFENDTHKKVDSIFSKLNTNILPKNFDPKVILFKPFDFFQLKLDSTDRFDSKIDSIELKNNLKKDSFKDVVEDYIANNNAIHNFESLGFFYQGNFNLVKVYIYDSNKEVLNKATYSHSTLQVIKGFDLSDVHHLEIILENQKSIKEFNFELSDIKLPKKI